MANHLAGETSPYLLQHADNPVDWYPWGEQALALARRENKPILLSIGYSTCHWCHVMAQECFEDAGIAALLNRHFVNIKVDREERPDLDQIYQSAHQFLTGRGGGWPLNMFLTPDQVPFFGGTYFPKTPRYNLPGFTELIPLIAQSYLEKQAEIGQLRLSLDEALAAMQPDEAAEGNLDASPLAGALRYLKQAYDPVNGGFGKAPKFPRPMDLEFLLRRYAASGDHDVLRMARDTLRAMARGGIFDQLGGGFCRYSVDDRWAIPHFEKMLYDNGQLLSLYSDAWLATGDPLFRQVVEDTCAWVLREMQAPEGGYYSALDADSEHVEGKFYVWDRDEVAALLTPEEYRVAAPAYGFDLPPNFEGQHWNPILARELASFVAEQELGAAEALLASARHKLFAAREQRIRPGRDEKILSSWNALMIKGMARAGRVFGNPAWLASARRSLDFIRREMWRDGRLLASHKDGLSQFNAYLDDYAFLLDALLETMQAEVRADDVAWARALADVLLASFEDPEKGGFYFTSHDHENLLCRMKPGHDNATPSGNGVASHALPRLGHIVGEVRYLAAAERAIRLFHAAASSQSAGYISLLAALEECLLPPLIVVLRGRGAEEWLRKLNGHYFPRAIVLAVPAGIIGLPDALNKPEPAHVNAWVCSGVSCLSAIDTFPALLQVCSNTENII
ncbi:MAG: thioredoxin domain-containing protein [Burkholderiales bacterium]